MKVEVIDSKDLEREISVSIDADEVEAAMGKKFAELKRTVELKGFRKGKVPIDKIKELFGDQVKLDVADDIIKESYPKAVEKNNLKVATRPSITDLSFNDNGGLDYKAKMEVFPDIDSINLEGIKLESFGTETSDEEVDQAVDHMRKQASELRPLDREAKEGDVVVADMKKISDSKNAIPQDDFPDSQIDLGNNLTVKEFRKEIPGMKAGDEKEVLVKYDEDYSDPAFANAEIKYNCKVKTVNERILPEFNDAFAKMTGQAETALELRLKIRENLTAQKDSTQKRTFRTEIVEQVCKKNQVAVPQGLLTEYLESVAKEAKERTPDLNVEEMKTAYRETGENTIRWDILYHTLAEQEKIEVLPADTENWINGFAQANGMTAEQATQTLRQSGKVQGLLESLLEQKVLDFLTEKATISDVKK